MGYWSVTAAGGSGVVRRCGVRRAQAVVLGKVLLRAERWRCSVGIRHSKLALVTVKRGDSAAQHAGYKGGVALYGQQ